MSAPRPMRRGNVFDDIDAAQQTLDLTASPPAGEDARLASGALPTDLPSAALAVRGRLLLCTAATSCWLYRYR
jgi:hypothetical protein